MNQDKKVEIQFKMNCPVHGITMITDSVMLCKINKKRSEKTPFFYCKRCDKYYINPYTNKNNKVKYGIMNSNGRNRAIMLTTNKITKFRNDIKCDYIPMLCDAKNQPVKSSTKSSSKNKSSTPKNEVKNNSKKNNSKTLNEVRIHKFVDKDSEQIKKLENILKILKVSYPEIIGSRIDINHFIKTNFPSKLSCECCVRNLSYDLPYSNKEMIYHKAEIYRIKKNNTDSLGKDNVLVFVGHLKQGEFYIDDIKVKDNPVKKVDDVDCSLYFLYDGANNSNYLYDILDKPAKNAENLSKEITYWNEYLEWKKQLAEIRIKGLKYLAYQLDIENNGINFLVVSDGFNEFKDFERYLKRNEVSIFSNNFSNDRYLFDFNKEGKNNSSNDVGIVLNFKEIIDTYEAEDIDVDYWQEQQRNAKRYNDDNNAPKNLSAVISYIQRTYQEPMFYEIAFELSDDTLDFLNRQIKRNGYISSNDERIISRDFYFDGFIATSLIGEFSLIKRLKKAVENLTSGKSVSDGLEQWLFNIEKAREPKKIENVTEWQNDKINDFQKDAVRKILSAPDVCLIQGPPGTGKTTVIAEAVYQFIIRNKRVLISSQANLAVDNALERLIVNPKVRAIRLGNSGKIDSSVNNITENQVLGTFYNSIDAYLHSAYLNKWDEIDEKAQLYQDKLNSYNNYKIENQTLAQEISNLKFSLIDDELKIQEDINSLEQNKDNLQKVIEMLSDEKEGKINVNFCMDDILTIYNKIKADIHTLHSNNIELTKCVINKSIDVDTANLIIEEIINNIISICSIRKRFCVNKDVDTNDEIEKAKLIVKKLEEQWMEDDDLEIGKKYRDAKIKLKRLLVSSNSLLENEYKLFLIDKELASDKDTVLKIIKQCNKTIEKLKKNLVLCIEKVEKNVDSKLKEMILLLEKTKNEKVSKQIQIEEMKITLEANKANMEEILNTLDTNEDMLADKVASLQDKAKENENKIINRSDWESIFREYSEWVKNTPDYEQENEVFLDDFINGCNVVGVSCTENSRTLEDKGFDAFDVVIIDEVSKATPPELLIPMLKGKKIVLVGDHRQLPPLFNEHQNTYFEVVDSIDDDSNEILTKDNFNRFKDMVTSSLFEKYFETANDTIKQTLLYQYRMHKDIMDIVNFFYDGKLIDGNNSDKVKVKEHGLTISGLYGTKMIVPKNHAYWFDSSELDNVKIYEQRKEGSTSAENLLEAEIIVELLKKVDQQYMMNNSDKVSVGVISFYYDQVVLIRNLLKKETFFNIDIDVNTVDRFQGKEKEIVFVSLVRNTRHAKLNINSHIASFQRINVAFSRAQNMLVIVGAKDMYADQPVRISNLNDNSEKTIMVYKEIIELLEDKGAFFTSDEVINESLASEIIDTIKIGRIN